MSKNIAIEFRTLFLTAFVLATIALGSTDAAWAGTIKLHGRISSGALFMACIDAPDGTATGGTGPGGYGCKTPRGEVSCTAQGKCTGTCSSCGK